VTTGRQNEPAIVNNLKAISGRTRLTAIFGDPVEHSLSPAMHNAAYAALGIDRAYVACHVKAEHLAAAIGAIPALGIAGVNLTVPHKEAAVGRMAQLSGEAQMLGAVNCVINREGELYGDNTDARGLETDLRESGIALEGQLVIIVGAGGAAASAVLACTRLRADKILLCNRTIERAAKLTHRLSLAGAGGRTGTSEIGAGGLDLLAQPAIVGDAALVINATPMGLKTGGFAEFAYDGTRAECIFYDMVYARDPTPFMTPALACGRRALDGAGMLVHQGALAFELFNNLAAPTAVMRMALMTALGRA
jgi:shikimate dehydrogenase